MDIREKEIFEYLYDNVLIETTLVSSAKEVQDLVQKVIEKNEQLDYSENLVSFIKVALEEVPLNWLTWEILLNSFWQEYISNDVDDEVIESLKREKFVSDYRLALFHSKIYNTKDDVIDVAIKILNWDIDIDKDDTLVIFIKNALDSWYVINNLTWEELSDAFNIIIPWINVISDSCTIGNIDLNLMNWTSFIYKNRMLVFDNWKMFYCDISNCDKSHIINKNDSAIKKYMQLIWKKYEESRLCIESIVE